MRALLQQAVQAWVRALSAHTTVLLYSPITQEWEYQKPTPRRLNPHSYHWPTDDPPTHAGLRDLVDDAFVFFKSRMWYRKRGIPYRRGYLLAGPPQCGKMFFVRRIAAHAGKRESVYQLSWC